MIGVTKICTQDNWRFTDHSRIYYSSWFLLFKIVKDESSLLRTLAAIILRMIQFLLIMILGWMNGIFINYLSDVLPSHRKITVPTCPSCNSRIPIWSYLFWPRRCPSCGQARSKRVWVVELSAIVITLWLWYNPSPTLDFIFGYLLATYLGTVFVIDIEHHLILHPVSIVGAVLCLGIGIGLRGFPKTLLGGLGGLGIMMVLYLFGILFSRSMMRWKKRDIEPEGMGFGDVILSGVLGLLLGWPGITFGLTLGIIAAGLFTALYLLIAMATRRYRSFGTIPYGPFLIIGAILPLLFRDQLIAILGTR